MTILGGYDRAKYLKTRTNLKDMGTNVFFQPRNMPNDLNLIRFHNNIAVASGVTFISHDVMHLVFNAKNDASLRVNEGCIEIMDNVFIGSNSSILPDVRIGPNAIVAAGAVVTKDVPEGSIVGGAPAKVIGSFADLEARRLHAADFLEGRPREEMDEMLWADFYGRRDVD